MNPFYAPLSRCSTLNRRVPPVLTGQTHLLCMSWRTGQSVCKCKAEYEWALVRIPNKSQSSCRFTLCPDGQFPCPGIGPGPAFVLPAPLWSIQWKKGLTGSQEEVLGAF